MDIKATDFKETTKLWFNIIYSLFLKGLIPGSWRLFFCIEANECLPKEGNYCVPHILFEYVMSVTTDFCSFILLDISQTIKEINFTSGTESIQTFYRFTFLS